jgi:2-polyprenyl-3-methyl-5-hydroxy-6-metoxy-1,4-benzoquinol methylase
VTPTFREPFYQRYVSGHQGVLDATRRHPTLKRDVIAHLPPDRLAAILDVGCGQGDLVQLIREHGWTNVVGVDTSAEQIEAARGRGVTGVAQADLFDYASSHLGKYDAVLAIDVVEHFDRSEVLHVFQTLHALLAPGGCLIIQAPNGASPFSGRIFWSDITHGMQYTSRSLRQICMAAGFDSVESSPQRPAVHGPISALRWVAWRMVEAFLVFATAAETGRTGRLVLTQNIVAVARRSRFPSAEA